MLPFPSLICDDLLTTRRVKSIKWRQPTSHQATCRKKIGACLSFPNWNLNKTKPPAKIPCGFLQTTKLTLVYYPHTTIRYRLCDLKNIFLRTVCYEEKNKTVAIWINSPNASNLGTGAENVSTLTLSTATYFPEDVVILLYYLCASCLWRTGLTGARLSAVHLFRSATGSRPQSPPHLPGCADHLRPRLALALIMSFSPSLSAPPLLVDEEHQSVFTGQRRGSDSG